MSQVLTQLQKEELIFGYIRQTSNYNIPMVLIKLCLAYFESVFYWNLRGKNLKRFLNTKFKENMVSKPYFYNDIQCNLEIYPNGLLDGMVGDVSLFIQPIIPSNITYIEAILKFIFNDKILTSTYKLFDENNTDWGWTDWVLSLSDCRKYSQLSFAVNMKILNIKYKDNRLQYTPQHIIKMYKELKEEWIIDKDQINEFKKYKCGKIYQSSTYGYDNNLCLSCFPNGGQPEQEGSLMFGVNLIQIPHKIQAFGVDIILEEKEKKIKCQSKIEFDPMKDAASFYWGTNQFQTKWLNDVLSLRFSVSIIVKYIVDREGNEIPEAEWNLYGIVD